MNVNVNVKRKLFAYTSAAIKMTCDSPWTVCLWYPLTWWGAIVVTSRWVDLGQNAWLDGDTDARHRGTCEAKEEAVIEP